MGPSVEANSLSDITQIASNPPKYPRNPTEKQRDPLTLYIARVPGSRDIILTTLKPQLKNVTAEDIASSLYYFHLNTEDDARLLAEAQENALAEAPVEKPLPRKPLPDTARSSVDINGSEETAVPRAVHTTTGSLHRKPLPVPCRPSLDLDLSESVGRNDSSCNVDFSFGPRIQRKETTSSQSGAEPNQQAKNSAYTPNQSHAQAKEVQRKPLGPRSLGLDYSTERKPLPGVENQPPSSRPQSRSFAPSKVSSDSGRSESSRYSELKADGSVTSFPITIIRRDPSSNAQWNVGSVTGESQNRGMNAMSNIKKPYSDISVHLITPGYNYFRNSQSATYNDNQSQLHNRQAAKDESAASDWGFHRRVAMEGSNFFERASKIHKGPQSDALDMLAEARGNPATYGVESRDSTADTRDSSSKGYVFLSPWGGRCKFATGGGGRSLRCKHTLPKSLSSTNAVFESSGSAVVSELKFNLPYSAVFKPHVMSPSIDGGTVETKRFLIPKFGHIRNKLSTSSRPPLPPRPDPTSYAALYPSDDEQPPPLPSRAYADQRVAGSSDEQERLSNSIRSHPKYTPRSPNKEFDDDERLDLSIGREKAGGGNRGKRAKLGKLIIHNEGFKMLDLVVAANMGIWWSIFDNR